MDPVIQQIAAGRFPVIARQHLLNVVQPQLDELAQLREENAALRARVQELEQQQLATKGAKKPAAVA